MVREYIEDIEGNPTIYNIMPLRAKFRTFVDSDTNELIGVVPLLAPIVMKRALKSGLQYSIRTINIRFLHYLFDRPRFLV